MKYYADNEELSEEEKGKSKKDEPTLNTEDNLELSGLKFSERMRIKKTRIKEHMEGMSKKEKAKYLVMYFKWYGIVAAIVLVALIYTGYCIYENTRPIALSYGVINCRDVDNIDASFEADYKTQFGLTDKKYKIESDFEIFLGNPVHPDDMKQEDYSNATKISTLCFNDYFDVFITDELGAKHAADQGIFFPLNVYFPEDVYNQLQPYEYIAVDYEGKKCPVAINISGTEFAKQLNPGYDDVYIGFAGRKNTNYLNSLRMINYSLKLNLEITAEGRPKLN